jgi:lipoic acid synthetase
MTQENRFDTRPAVRARKLNKLPPNPETPDSSKAVKSGRFPSWLHRKMPKGGNLWKTDAILEGQRLHTVCEEAKCPNLTECWSKKTATFLIMGKECTRSCGFCDIDFSKNPQPLEDDEPLRVAESVKQLGLQHVVITMVARDDIPDQGAAHIAKVIAEVSKASPKSTIEILTSDFSGQQEALDVIIDAQPEIFNHNIETVRDLTPRVRHVATYDRTLSVLNYVSRNKKGKTRFVKSGIMVGLGESAAQVKQTLDDLKEIGCDIVTMGQYLQPNRQKLVVKEFVTPETFKQYEDYGKEIGIPHMFCGPFVRSSYNAAQVFEDVSKNESAIRGISTTVSS